jgi:hypothetical protein
MSQAYEAYIDDQGVARWKTNNRVIPADCIDPNIMEMPGFNFKATWDTRQKETDAALAAYRKNPPRYSDENLAEAWNELGPDAVNVITGRRLFPNGQPPFRRSVNTARRERAAVTLNKIKAGDTVTFVHDGVNYTASVDSVNQTTATVTITKIDGRPRSKNRTVGTKVRVSAGIIARR